jgi:hypothetical protein
MLIEGYDLPPTAETKPAETLVPHSQHTPDRMAQAATGHDPAAMLDAGASAPVSRHPFAFADPGSRHKPKAV